MRIARAYEVLRDPETRADYDAMLERPDARLDAYYRYYRRRVAVHVRTGTAWLRSQSLSAGAAGSVQVDPRLVIVALLVLLSGVQYWNARRKYRTAVQFLLRYEPARQRLLKLVDERGLMHHLRDAAGRNKLPRVRGARVLGTHASPCSGRCRRRRRPATRRDRCRRRGHALTTLDAGAAAGVTVSGRRRPLIGACWSSSRTVCRSRAAIGTRAVPAPRTRRTADRRAPPPPCMTSAPRLTDLLVCRLVMAPVNLARALICIGHWWFRCVLRGLPPTAGQREYLTRRALGMSSAAWEVRRPTVRPHRVRLANDAGPLTGTRSGGGSGDAHVVDRAGAVETRQPPTVAGQPRRHASRARGTERHTQAPASLG